jgi:hypothetical protein
MGVDSASPWLSITSHLETRQNLYRFYENVLQELDEATDF